MRALDLVPLVSLVPMAALVAGLGLAACSSDSSSSGRAVDASVRETSGPVPCSGVDGSCCPEAARVFTGGTCDSDLGGVFCPDTCGLTYECNGVSWSTVQGGTSTCATDGDGGDARATETGPDAPDDALVDAPAE